MSDAVACPACQKVLPDSVVKGPAQAVVRCEGCATLLLWSHGKVVRSARSSSPSTLMGMQVQKPPAPAAMPSRPAPKATLMGIPSAPEPAKPAPPVPKKEEAKPPQKPVIAAAVPQPAKAMPGPMENPSEWFDEAAVVQFDEDDEPTKVGSEPEPLPPLDPQPTSLTARKPDLPAQKTVMGASPAQQKTVMAPAPALPKTPAPAQQKTVAAPAPVLPKTPAPAQQKTVTAPAPILPKTPAPAQQKTLIAEPPKPAEQKTLIAEPPKIEPPKIEEPRAATPTPTPLGGAMEPVLDLSSDRRRPPIVYAAIAAGGALVLVLAMFFAFRGGKPEPPKPSVVAEKAPEPPPKPAVVVEKAPQPPPKPAVVAEKAPEPPPPAHRTQPEPPVEVAAVEPAPSSHRKRTLGGKKVVLEDDTRSAPVEKPQEDPAQVERAREAYKKGNEKLFSGNSAGAIESYKESLSIYPGYVAGYRGLGLAYAQSGNSAEALKALKTYVKTVPNAHDVPLIMKRIERLEKNPQD
jgi:hypothetical protein